KGKERWLVHKGRENNREGAAKGNFSGKTVGIIGLGSQSWKSSPNLRFSLTSSCATSTNVLINMDNFSILLCC
ncbi:unnamed protein product, partial [Prunus brigantina]